MDIFKFSVINVQVSDRSIHAVGEIDCITMLLKCVGQTKNGQIDDFYQVRKKTANWDLITKG